MNMDDMMDEICGPTEPTIYGSLYVNGQHICDGGICLNDEKKTGRLNLDLSVKPDPSPPYEKGLIRQSNGVEVHVAEVALCSTTDFPHMHFRIL